MAKEISKVNRLSVERNAGEQWTALPYKLAGEHEHQNPRQPFQPLKKRSVLRYDCP
jgi:hypothetical protein